MEREISLDRHGEGRGPAEGQVVRGVYYLRATKKVLGMRLLTPARQRREQRTKALAPAAGARESLTTQRRR